MAKNFEVKESHAKSRSKRRLSQQELQEIMIRRFLKLSKKERIQNLYKEKVMSHTKKSDKKRQKKYRSAKRCKKQSK